MGSILCPHRHDLASVVLVEDADQVLDVESLAAVVEELWQILVLKLLPVELLCRLSVNDVALVAHHEPAMLVDPSAFLVYEEALLSLQQHWHCSVRPLIEVVVKISHEVMRVEVILLDAEWGGDLAFLIHVFS